MEVRAGGTPRRADIADMLSLTHLLTFLDHDP